MFTVNFIVILLIVLHFVTGRRIGTIEKSHLDNDNNHAAKLEQQQQQHHRSLATDDKHKKLQYSHFNWDRCTNAAMNRNYTPMNSLVPNNTVFLTTFPTYKIDNSSTTCRDKTITRTAAINIGQQTVFFPLYRTAVYDFEDDWKLGECANSTQETLTQRLDAAAGQNLMFSNATYMDTIYYDLDGKAAQPVYLYDTSEYHLLACNDENKTDEEYFKLLNPNEVGDTCDAEPFQLIKGMDVYPILGWYGIDIREWVDNETHVYEFGSVLECVTAKYIITAKNDDKVQQPSSTTSQGNHYQHQLGSTKCWLWFFIIFGYCYIFML